MPLNSKTIKNILVCRNDRFGEFLLNIPAMRALKETFPDAKIIAITDPYVKELAGCIPFIDEIICWNAKPHSFIERLKLIAALRKKHFDIAVILNPTGEMHMLTALAGIPVRLGYDRKCGFLLTHRLKDRKHLEEKHEIAYNLDLVSLIGAKTNNLDLSLSINDDIIKQSMNLLELANVNPEGRSDNILAAIHPWTSDPVKKWPTANFLQLAQSLAQDPRLTVLIIGGKEEEDNAGIFKNAHSRIIDLTGKTSLTRLAAVLQRCALLISCDSGPVHLATAVKIPVLAIFRNDLPGKSALRWGPAGKNAFVIEDSRLENIPVNTVLDKAREILSI
ncbi:MAG: glycosyltransferase family 9 protein [Candidatus Omnitrophota bacterium]